jgi:hypothetical protein
MKFRIVFWDVMPSDVSEVCAASIIRDEWLIPDDGGNTNLWNVGR